MGHGKHAWVAWGIVGCAMASLVGCVKPHAAEGERAVVKVTQLASSTSSGKAAPRPALAPPTIQSRPSVQYLWRLSEAVENTRIQMPAITSSAEVAADRAVRGARLFVAGTQVEFLNEMIDRAGGLAMVKPLPKILNRGDVILYAVPSRLTVADRGRIANWRSRGVFVIAFASTTLSADPYFQPDVLVDSGEEEGLPLADGKMCPTDTVINLLNAWTWTGEFVAACTRLGRMPVLNQNPGENGALHRAARYRGLAFHDDLQVSAVPPGALGNAYLDCIAESLAAIAKQAPPTLEFGGRWLRATAADARGLYAASHLFPAHFKDTRAPQPFGTSGELQLRQAPQTAVSVVIGYQDPPQIAIDRATMRRGRLIYTSARRDGADHRQEVLYVNPHWPSDDACVGVDGYDITILPSSSVMQAAVYWSLLAETAGVARSK